MNFSRGLGLGLLLAPGVGFLLLFFGLPLALAVLGSVGLYTLGEPQGLTFRHYLELFTTRTYLDGLRFTLYLSLASTFLSLLVALPLTALLQQSFPGKQLFNALFKIPLIVPGIVAAFLILTLVDRGGILPRMAEQLGFQLPRLVRDPWASGVLLGMAWKTIPFMTLIIGGSMASIPRDVPIAARTLGAKPWVVFTRIQIPLALPGITAAVLLVFVTSTGAFAIPNLLGPIYPLPLSVLMYDQAFEQNRWGLVAAMGTVISLISCGVLLVYYRLTRSAQQAFSAGRN